MTITLPDWLHDDIIGYIGGFILSLCLTPQIIKALKTNSTEDISFIWQAMYIIGLSGTVTYTWLEGVLPVAIRVSVELTFMCIITLIKFKYDIIHKKCRNKNNHQRKPTDKQSLINNNKITRIIIYFT